jgi:Na+/proline symporter
VIPLGVLAQTRALPALDQPEILAVAAAYFVVCAAIAWWSTRRTHTVADFYVAGRGIGIWSLAIAAMAATLSGFAFIGGPGLVYALGTGAVFIVLPAALTGALSGWALARPLRLLAEVRGVMTIPAAIGARYRSPAAQGLAGMAILAAVIGYLATNLVALGLVLDALFGLGHTPAIVLGAAIVLSYTMAGGILAGIYTDLFQGAVMAIASTLVFGAVLESGGGLAELSRTILANEPGWFGPWGTMSPVAALSFFFVFGLGTLGQPHVVHKFYMIRDPRRLRWYPLLMTGALLLTLLLYVGIGLAMKAQVLRGVVPALGTPDDATPTFLLRFASPLLAGVVFSGVAAAIMSTANSFLSIGAAALTQDLPAMRGWAPLDSLAAGRIATLVVAVVALVAALGSTRLIALLGVYGWGMFAATLVPALAIGLNWPGATRVGAIAAIATGLVGTLALEGLAWAKVLTLPSGVSIAGITMVAAILVFIGISMVTRSDAAGDVDPDVKVALGWD